MKNNVLRLTSLNDYPRAVTSFLLFLILLFSVSGYFLQTASAIEASDLSFEKYGRSIQNIENSIDRERRITESMRDELLMWAGTQGLEDVTAGMLEQAQLEVEAANSELDNVKGRLQVRRDDASEIRDRLNAIEDEINSLAGAHSASAGKRLSRLMADHQELDTQSAWLEKLVDRLSGLENAIASRAAVTQRRLEMLQGRFELSDITQVPVPVAERERIQSDLDDLLSEAADFRDQSDSISGTSIDDLQRKRLLNMMAMDATERAALKQQELKLLKISSSLDSLAALSENSSLPAGTLKSASVRLDRLRSSLQEEKEILGRKKAILNNQHAQLKKRKTTATVPSETLQQQISIVESLRTALDAQSERVDTLEQSAAQSYKQYIESINDSSRRELLQRYSLPRDAYAWRELAGAVAILPFRVVRQIVDAGRDLVRRFIYAPNNLRFQVVIASLGFIAFILVLRQKLLPALIDNTSSRTMRAPARVLRRNLLGLLTPGLVLIAAWMLKLPASGVILLMTLLLIWPAIKLLINLAWMLLIEPESDRNQEFRQQLYREIRWVVILVGLLAAVSIIAHVVALTPVVLQMLDRLSMLILLILAFPAVHMRGLLIPDKDTVRESGFWLRAGALLSLVIPVILVGSALTGLIGYTNLAWAVLSHLGWLIIVVAAFFLVRGGAQDGMHSLSQRIERRFDSAEFWIQHMLLPLYRVLALVLVALAAYVLFLIYGWNLQTPVIRWIPELLGVTLFTVGETTIKLSDLVLSVALVIIVFWAGNWSKQFGYRYAYIKVSDPGIRQSLSTFTQYIVVVFGLMIALKTIGLDLTALTVFAGALGVGIGFGLQNITSNFISGVLLLVERPLRATDIVNVDNFEGEVTHIGLRALTLKTWDKQDVIIPNSSVISKPFTNWTRGDDTMRTLLMIGISYDDDPHQAVEAIDEIVSQHPASLESPAPKILLWEFADSAVMIRVQFFTNINGSIGRADVRSQVLFAIWDRFRELGIRIPYPQRDVHIHTQSGSELAFE